jgi:ubiquinone/menaquinone biosynthesis C-methylase UbiE
MQSSRAKQQFFDLWALFYDCPLTTIVYRAVHERLLAAIHLPERANVLDLGCGTGRLLDRLAASQPDLRGIGLDFSEVMLRQARRTSRHRTQLIFVSGAVAPLRFADEQFDAVFSTFSFMHYPEPESAIAEIRRVLRPGGRFYWVEATSGESTGVRYVAATPGGLRLHSPAAREALGERVGLRLVEHRYLFPSILLSTFAKPKQG